jgi:hypothetical protein
MQLIKRITKYLLIICIFGYLITTVIKPPLPEKPYITSSVIDTSPIQTKVLEIPFTKNINDFTYQFTPLYTYELYGLIVSDHDSKSFMDISHSSDPGNTRDICVVWGENISNGAYKKVRYHSGDFTCFYEWSGEANPQFSNEHIANNHIIPATDEIAKMLTEAEIGDEIHLKGTLANYLVQDKNKQTLFTRNSSTSRTDTGNGACEIMYVDTFQIIKKGSPEFSLLKKISFWGLIATVLLSIILFFIPEKSSI